MALLIKKTIQKKKKQFQDMEDYKTRHRHELDFGITNYSQVKVNLNEEEQLKVTREHTTSCVIQITSQFTVSLPPSTHETQGGVVTNSQSPPSTSEGRKVRRSHYLQAGCVGGEAFCSRVWPL